MIPCSFYVFNIKRKGDHNMTNTLESKLTTKMYSSVRNNLFGYAIAAGLLTTPLCVGGCGEEKQSSCCEKVQCGSDEICTDSPIYDQVKACVKDKDDKEYCCGCKQEPSCHGKSCI